MKRILRVGNIAVGNGGLAYDPVEARALPYASMDAKLGISLHSLVILLRYDGPDLHWYSADKITLITRQGRIITTNGFPDDLLKTQFWTPDPITDRTAAQGHTVRLLDLAYRSLYGLTVDSEWENQGVEHVDIYGQVYTLQRTVERCICRQRDWSFENTFWRDENNFVWKSKQHYTPTAPPLELAVLKPADGSR